MQLRFTINLKKQESLEVWLKLWLKDNRSRKQLISMLHPSNLQGS